MRNYVTHNFTISKYTNIYIHIYMYLCIFINLNSYPFVYNISDIETVIILIIHMYSIA